MTNVLIPTDFTVQSLDLVSAASQQVPGKINAFLFHAFDMPESLIDAMRRTGTNSPDNLITEELRLRCRQIKALNPMIANISFKLMYGSTVAVFKHFADANNVEAIALPAGYKFTAVVRDSVDPTRMFLKSGIALIRDFDPKTQNAIDTLGKIYQKPQATERLVLR